MLTFIETKLFTKLIQEYLADDEYSALQQALIGNPEAVALIRGSGGCEECAGTWPAVGSVAGFA
jgi:hypothetical protein